MVFILGIILAKLQAYSVGLAIILICLSLFLVYPRKRTIVFFAMIILIFSYWTSFLQMSEESELAFLQNERVNVEAQIIKVPVEKEGKKELILQTTSIEMDDKIYPMQEKVLANIYYYNNEEEMDKKLSEGDRITFHGKVKMPRGLRNPGGFDYSFYLRTKGIYSTITVSPETIKVEGKESLGLVWDFIFKVRRNVVKVVDENLSKDHSALLKGILFGEKELDSSIRNTFVDSGIAHILAVSGLHVGFLVGFILYFTSLFKASDIIKITLISISLAFYILITGASPSVIRASMMVWIYLFSKILGKKYDGISALSLAGFIILIINPLLLFTASFQLSFLAALSIILFYPVLVEYFMKVKYLPLSIGKLMAVTIAAQIGTLPVALYHFHQVSLISVVSNLLIIPLLGILLVTCLMAIIFYFIFDFIGSYLFFLAGFLFKWMIGVANIFSSLNFSSISLPVFTIGGVILYVLLCLLMGRYIPMKAKKIRYSVWILIFSLTVFSLVQYLWPSPLLVTYLDVNQGDSILIETPKHKTILIDGGGYRGNQADRKTSEEVLLPAFYSKRITALDLVILSHPHDDHMKGLEELMGEIPIHNLGLYEIENKEMKSFLKKARLNDIPILHLSDKNTIEIEEDIKIEVLSPKKGMLISNQQKDVNNASVVLRMDYDQRSFLFTGDIEREMENQLLQDGKNIKVDVLKVAHHGSQSSSQESFLKKTLPKISVISLGENNAFGHPDPRTIEQLDKISSHIYRTDERGAVEISTNGSWLKVKSYVEEKDR